MRPFVISTRKFIWVKQYRLFWWCIRCSSNKNDGFCLYYARSGNYARVFLLCILWCFFISFFYRFILFSIGSFFFLSVRTFCAFCFCVHKNIFYMLSCGLWRAFLRFASSLYKILTVQVLLWYTQYVWKHTQLDRKISKILYNTKRGAYYEQKAIR